MVTIRSSALVADARGAIGGNVFARNKAGLYVRARIKPLNPRSVRQQQVRAYVSAAAAAWGAITIQERADWQAYALNTSWTNRLGDSINIGGEAAFVRVNCMRLIAGWGTRAAAPDQYGHAQSTVATVTASAGTQTPILAEPSSGFSGAVDGTNLFVYAAMPQPGSRDMAPSRYRYLQVLNGSAGAPINWPFTLGTWPWVYAEGQKVTVGLIHADADSRYSVRTFASVIAAA